MDTGAMIVLLCIITTVIASVLVVSACILSARIGHAENMMEQYDDVENTPQPQVARRPYSVEG